MGQFIEERFVGFGECFPSWGGGGGDGKGDEVGCEAEAGGCCGVH